MHCAKGILHKTFQKKASDMNCLKCGCVQGCVRRPHRLGSVTMSLAVGTRMRPISLGQRCQVQVETPFFFFFFSFFNKVQLVDTWPSAEDRHPHYTEMKYTYDIPRAISRGKFPVESFSPTSLSERFA